MTEFVNSRVCAVMFAALACLTAATATQAEAPTNKQLIAAMPPATESVLIQRYGILLADDSALKTEAQELIDNLGNIYSGEERDALLNVVLRHVAMAKPVVHAEGGSQFTRVTGDPLGVGVGNYNSRSIWCVERSLDRLMKRLAEKPDISGALKTFKLGGVPVYHSELRQYLMKGEEAAPIQEDRFVAFPSDRCVVITEDRDELKHILDRLESKASGVPEKWREVAAALELESPIVLLREYDPQNKLDYYSPVNPTQPDYKQADVQSVCLVVPSPKRLAFRLNCISKEPQKALAFYGYEVLCYETYRWDTKLRQAGFNSEVAVVDEKRDEAYPFLSLYILFGMNVFI